jgi:hypothetical protein
MAAALGVRWRMLHRLVYVAVPLSVRHYLWLERDIITGAQIAAVVVGVLFVLRLPALRRSLARLRRGESVAGVNGILHDSLCGSRLWRSIMVAKQVRVLREERRRSGPMEDHLKLEKSALP